MLTPPVARCWVIRSVENFLGGKEWPPPSMHVDAGIFWEDSVKIKKVRFTHPQHKRTSALGLEEENVEEDRQGPVFRLHVPTPCYFLSTRGKSDNTERRSK